MLIKILYTDVRLNNLHISRSIKSGKFFLQGAVNFALMMSQMEGGCPVDYNTITDLFLQVQLIFPKQFSVTSILLRQYVSIRVQNSGYSLTKIRKYFITCISLSIELFSSYVT